MGKFEIFQGKKADYFFRLKAGNGEIILSSEGYTAKQNCKNGIEAVKVNASDNGRYERRDTPTYKFNLKAANGEIIGRSENYGSKLDREGGIASVKANAGRAVVVDLT